LLYLKIIVFLFILPFKKILTAELFIIQELARGVPQVVEQPPNKDEALSSNSRPPTTLPNYPGGIVHACNPTTQETEAGGFQDLGKYGLNKKALSQKTKKF
jgi:hypothetical protein